jgi:hypothetical protein
VKIEDEHRVAIGVGRGSMRIEQRVRIRRAGFPQQGGLIMHLNSDEFINRGIQLHESDELVLRSYMQHQALGWVAAQCG